MKIIDFLRKHNLYYGAGVPCSNFINMINEIIKDSNFHYIPATNEGEAVSIASGFSISGKPSFVLMQNSGLGSALDPITSLINLYKIPVVLLISFRGNPIKIDEPQHIFMGNITERIIKLCDLEVIQIENEIIFCKTKF